MVRSILGTKRKSSASGDLKEKPADQKRSRTADGGKKGVDYITVKSGKEREDFRIGDCILVRSEKKSMPYVRLVIFSWEFDKNILFYNLCCCKGTHDCHCHCSYR